MSHNRAQLVKTIRSPFSDGGLLDLIVSNPEFQGSAGDLADAVLALFKGGER